METVESRTPYVRDPRAKYRQSLEVLRVAKEAKEGLITKTSLMLGVGETDEEILQTLKGASVLRVAFCLACFADAPCGSTQTCGPTTSTSSRSASTCGRPSAT